eukprot:1348362-Rhodomonas_salina.2
MVVPERERYQEAYWYQPLHAPTRICYAMRCTDVVYAATRIHYAVWGTDIAYDFLPVVCDAWY